MDKKEERGLKMMGELKKDDLNGEEDMLINRIKILDMNIKSMKDVLSRATKTLKKYQMEKSKHLARLDKLFKEEKIC